MLALGGVFEQPEFPDSVKRMKRYGPYRETVEEADPGKHDVLTQRYYSGWALASAQYRKDIKWLYAEIPEKKGWQGQEVRELREGKWEKALEALLRMEKKTREDVEASKKSAGWIVGIAREMKRTTTATNPWLAKTLAMGHPSRVCNRVRNV